MRSKALTEGGPSTCPAPSPAIPWPKSRQLSSSSRSHAEPSRSDCTSYGFAAMASGSRAGRNSSPEAGPLGSAVDGRLGERRSEEHTSELQSHSDLVCRLLLEKKNNRK